MQDLITGFDALIQERAFADLSSFRKVQVRGSDACTWLDALATADIASLSPGHSRRSLVLSPSGHVRADFHVACDHEGFTLLQAPDQPEHIGLILGPYVLSADVLLRDATADLALFAVPGRAADLVGHPGVTPSVLGPGIDLICTTGKHAWGQESALIKAGLEEASPQAVEAWRIRSGVPRMGPDFDQGRLPSEAGLERLIAWGKGCFLGQESVAKVRNLGHPPTILIHVLCEGTLVAGEPVYAGAEEAGSITSATPDRSRSFAMARVRWSSSQLPLALMDGRPILPIAGAA